MISIRIAEPWSQNVRHSLFETIAGEVEKNWAYLSGGVSEPRIRFGSCPLDAKFERERFENEWRSSRSIPNDWPDTRHVFAARTAEWMMEYQLATLGNIDSSLIDENIEPGMTSPYSWLCPYSPLSCGSMLCRLEEERGGTTRITMTLSAGTAYETPGYRQAIATLPDGRFRLGGKNKTVLGVTDVKMFRLISTSDVDIPIDWTLVDAVKASLRSIDDDCISLHGSTFDPPWMLNPELRPRVEEWRRDRSALWPINRQVFVSLANEVTGSHSVTDVFANGLVSSEPPVELRGETAYLEFPETGLGQSKRDGQRSIPVVDKATIEEWAQWSKRRRAF